MCELDTTNESGTHHGESDEREEKVISELLGTTLDSGTRAIRAESDRWSKRLIVKWCTDFLVTHRAKEVSKEQTQILRIFCVRSTVIRRLQNGLNSAQQIDKQQRGCSTNRCACKKNATGSK
ncbi:unnamed protein product, partial [Mesorhabditis belari]|uniref:Uncharacterized protein n=1 Tax=Mesorhabditis belari TaxID=2138241 RepID=A0AAF3EHJ9_9BILA